MNVFIDQTLFTHFPNIQLGIIVVEGGANKTSSPELRQLLQEQVFHIQSSYTIESLLADPHIALWRGIYPQFGAKPRDYRSSIEALGRRCVNGKGLGSISPLVDAYNTISLKYLLPAGGEDLAYIQGDLRLTVAGPNEAVVKLLGDLEAQSPFPGEVIYRDDLSAVCRCWNWREAERTKLTENTTRCVLVIEDVNEDSSNVKTATEELAKLVEKECGGKTFISFLNAQHPTIVI